MIQYRNIRLSNNVLADLKAFQNEGESISDVIKRIHYNFTELLELVDVPHFRKEKYKDGSERVYLQIETFGCNDLNPCDLEFDYTREDLTNVIKVPREILNKIDWMRFHPDESYNTTIFKLSSLQKAMKEWSSQLKERGIKVE